MKKILALLFVVTCFYGAAAETRAEKLEIGARFPVENLTNEKKPADNTIVVFIPSLTSDCDYASMLTQSFYYYFDQKLAFEGLKKTPTTKIFFIVKDKPDEAKSTWNILGGMSVIYDEKGNWFSYFEVGLPVGKNADSTVVLLDSKDVISHIDRAYRAQGEHLKPLENKLKEQSGIDERVKGPAPKKALKVGDKAPDFRINDKEMLSDLRGTVVLLSFYPAAFSGKLPKPGEVYAFVVSPLFGGPQVETCIAQIKAIDRVPKKTLKEPRRIMISSSTASILDKWKQVIGTYNVEYANDPDYSVSSQYFSYNPQGYNNRVSVIVDQKGKVAYIDPDFTFNDEAALNQKMYELVQKDNK
jgi:peroxiredoxin